ncbi:MAG: polymer-forming cytoskeletal protein [Candidatus Omnitrophica bacterium]|nr:polymer-forming cytoskeletal protein [Candidatus Omnitrophota bacterium]
MLKRKEEKEHEKILDVDASMQGSLEFSDPVNLRINGKFEGNLRTRGVLTVGFSATVSAKIEGEEIIVGGKVNGDIYAAKGLTLLSSAVVKGDIKTSSLEVQKGAIFEGTISMLEEKMSLREVSRYLNIEEDKVKQWALEGRIPAIGEKDELIFEKEKIDAWIKGAK